MRDVMRQSGMGYDLRPGNLFPTLRIAGAAMLILMLTGCTGAKVSNLASTNAAGPAPAEILVDVSVSSVADAQAQAAREVGAKLQATLVQRLTESRITAEPFVPGTSHPGAAVLHVAITDADPGDAVERLVIGFGAGRAKLQAKADLESTDTEAAHSMASFDIAGDSGRKPGLILPGGTALATRDVAHLAIGGGLKLATSLNDGLDKPAKATSAAIVDQLKQYYLAAGWYWPAGSSV